MSQFAANRFLVLANIITKSEEKALVSFILHSDDADISLKRFRKRKYEYEHWDRAIAGYKEFQRPMQGWSAECQEILLGVKEKLVETMEMKEITYNQDFLSPHVLDLAADGEIFPHVDSVKHSGHIVSGLSLLSARKMKLTTESKELVEEMSLLPRSLYILFGEGREKLSHAIEVDAKSERRLAVILRDAI